MAKAEVDSGPEGNVPIRSPLKIEPLRMLIRLRVQVGCGQHSHDLVAFLQPNASEINVLSHNTRLGELHWRDKAQKLLNRQARAIPVLREPVAQFGILEKFIN